jgi:hypothetical protein
LAAIALPPTYSSFNGVLLKIGQGTIFTENTVEGGRKKGGGGRWKL